MPVLQASSVQDLKRLLELFPVADLRQVWTDITGTKSEVCQAVAEQRNHDQIANFVDQHVSCCKQHVYVFERENAGQLTLPTTVGGGEQVLAAGDHGLYLVRSVTRVVL